MKARNSNQLNGIHKYTGTLTFEFYGQPNYSTTDVFRYELAERIKEDPDAMLEDIKWTSEPIEILTWTEGSLENGKFVSEEGQNGGSTHKERI